MPNDQLVPSLFLFTLVSVVVIAFGAYAWFLRKRSNRHPVERPGLEGRTMAPTETTPSRSEHDAH